MNRKPGKYRTAPNLSSETLFHFTGDFTTLKSILENGFQARWIYEKLPGTKLAYLTKAVCFCDIPLGLIKEHINWYGTYGIGIKRSIAQKQGVSPIMYIHSRSPKFPKGNSVSTINWFIDFKFTNYLKQVKGKQMFFKDDGTTEWKWKTFYNEREWRYFPSKREIKVIKYDKETDLEDLRTSINNSHTLPLLSINPSWIEYILIQDPKEVKKLIKILNAPKYKSNFESLLTKVVTFKQIQNDF